MEWRSCVDQDSLGNRFGCEWVAGGGFVDVECKTFGRLLFCFGVRRSGIVGE